MRIVLLAVAMVLSISIEAQDRRTFEYCTEIGIFNLVIDNDEVAGVYSLNHKETLGAVWGKLENDRMQGRWLDPDGQGDIILEFNQDRTWFTANYRADDEPEKWYTDQWHGALRPQGKSTFESHNITLRCGEDAN